MMLSFYLINQSIQACLAMSKTFYVSEMLFVIGESFFYLPAFEGYFEKSKVYRKKKETFPYKN